MEWTDGMLYPVLHRLERLGLITARWELSEIGRRRKYYRITSRGREQLKEECRQWQAVDATLRGIWKMVSLPIPLNHPDLIRSAPGCGKHGGQLLQGA
jgi:DNA-binding PadR family transcriptional regulator